MPILIWYAAAFMIVVALGLLHLYFPFGPDQALALTSAKVLDAGGVLYVDFWDNKMPALFWFYHAAGELFGYSEFGVHALECVWMAVYSITLMVLLRQYYRHKWLSSVVAVTVVGVYYTSVGPGELTLLEMLIGLPIFVSLWFSSRAVQSNHRRFLQAFLAGIFAGFTVCFKLAFAPLFIVMWAALCYCIWVQGTTNRTRTIVSYWFAASAGVLLVLGLVVVHFYRAGALEQLLWTAFAYPPAAFESAPPAPIHRLVSSTGFYAAQYAPWFLFVFIAIRHWWKSERFDPLTIGLLVWLFVGFLLLVIQTFSWWAYHFFLLFPPTGILAVKGVDVLATGIRNKAPSIAMSPMMLTCLLIVASLGALASPATIKIRQYANVFLHRSGGVAELQSDLNPAYAKIRESVKFLQSNGARKGQIYVFGDPLYYHLSGRLPAAPIIGWPWEYFLRSQFRELPTHLAESKPAYIYIDVQSAYVLNDWQEGVPQFIGKHYIELVNDHGGTWYAAKPRSWGNQRQPKKPATRRDP